MVATNAARPDTRARWETAFAKVEHRCLGVRKVGNAYEVRSDSGNAYLVTGRGSVCTGCTCKAGESGDPVCFHRAAVYMAMGVGIAPAPQPAAPDPSCTDAVRAALAVHNAQWDYLTAPAADVTAAFERAALVFDRAAERIGEDAADAAAHAALVGWVVA